MGRDRTNFKADLVLIKFCQEGCDGMKERKYVGDGFWDCLT